ncbi:MAG: hypothetical protein AAGB00_04960 [Planctomycetota bacterium]
MGCTSITVDHPIGAPTGEETSAGVDLAAAIDGAWVTAGDEAVSEPGSGDGDNQVLYVKYAGNGLVNVAGVYWDGERFALETYRFLLCENRGELFLHWSETDNPPDGDAAPAADQPGSAGPAGKYEFQLVRVSEDSLKITAPDATECDLAVEAKTIAGQMIERRLTDPTTGEMVESRELHLTAGPAQLANFFAGDRLKKLFPEVGTVALRRIATLTTDEPAPEPPRPAEEPPAPAAPAPVAPAPVAPVPVAPVPVADPNE